MDHDDGPRPVVLWGPSGSGKTTLFNRLCTEFPDCFGFSISREFPDYFGFSISHTTREPRPGEQDGVDYYFVSKDEFDRLIENNEFLEHANNCGHWYGTSQQTIQTIRAAGRVPVLLVGLNSARKLSTAPLQPPPRLIFLQPPSVDVLKSRLQARGTETEESLQRRLAGAQEALDYVDNRSASQPNVVDHVIDHDDVDGAYQELKGILMEDIRKLQNAKGENCTLK